MKRIVPPIVIFLLISLGVSAQQPVLTLTNNDVDGLIPLEWSAASWDSAQIFRKRVEEGAVFEKLAITFPPENSYTDTADCELPSDYYIRFFSGGMGDNTDTLSIEETDPFPPEEQVLILDSISVTENNRINLSWQEFQDSTLLGYIVFIQNQTLDTLVNIADPSKTEYLLPDTLRPQNIHYNFLVIAYDQCNSSVPINSSNLQGTPFIEESNYNICQQNVTINFRPYNTNNIDSINQSATKHYLYRKDLFVGSNYVLRDSTTTDEPFTDTVEPDKLYRYFVRAKITSDYSETATSSSARTQVRTRPVPQPDTAYIESASVEGKTIKINGFSDSNGQGNGYVLLRSDNGSDFNRVIDSLNSGQTSWEITDQDAKPAGQSYYYKLIAIDSCGNNSKESNTARTIFLEVESFQNGENQLQWNHYEGWEVDHYLVYRYKNPGEPQQPIANISGNLNAYSDTQAGSLSSGQWIYRVRAIEGSGNPFGQKGSAWSNEVEANQQTQLKMPNAFKPSSNSHYTFKPVFRNINPENYSLRIYNRWGALIFESNEPGRGWDGLFKGEKAPAGTYVYTLQYKNQDGKKKQKKGTVTLIR